MRMQWQGPARREAARAHARTLVGPRVVEGFALLLALAAPAAAGTPFEDVVRAARAQGPTAQMGEEDLAIARHRLGRSVARLMPQVSASDRFNYRYNNPERYTFTIDSPQDCDPQTDPVCLPIAIGDDGQITLPENSLSNSLRLNGVLPVSSGAITGVLQQRLVRQRTELQVEGQDERLVFDLVDEYAELQYAVGALAIYEESLGLAEEMSRVVGGRHEVGEATDLELEQARIDLERADLAIVRIARDLPSAVRRIALLGGPVDEGLRVCPFPEPIDAGVALSVDASTRLRTAEVDLRMDRLGRTQARLDALPTLTLLSGASWTANGSTFDELQESFIFDNWYVGANLSLTLFDGFARHHARREAVASVRRSAIDLELERRTLELEDADLAQTLSEMAREIELSARGVALQAREVDAARALYFEGGDTSFDRYTQARNLLEQLRLQHLQLLRQQSKQTAQRWIAAGHHEALLDELYARERTADVATSCRVVPSDA